MRFWPTLFSLLFCAFLSPVLFAAGGESATAFRARGDISIAYRSDLNVQSRGLNFVVDYDGKGWVIVTQPHEYVTNVAKAYFRYYSVSSDGTNLYRVAAFNEMRDREATRLEAVDRLKERDLKLQQMGNADAILDNKRVLDNLIEQGKLSSGISTNITASKAQGGGSVSLGKMPKFNQLDLAAALWLAFCSGKDLGQLPPNLAPAFFDEISVSRSAERTNYYVNAGKRFFTGDIPFPQEIFFTNNGALYGLPASASVNSVEQLRKPGDFDYVQAHFKSVLDEKGNGRKIPQGFTLTRYVPIGEEGGTRPTKVLYKIECVVNEIETIDQKVTPKELDVAVKVRDTRFAAAPGQPAIGYVATPGQWKSTQEVANMPEFKRDAGTFENVEKEAKSQLPDNRVRLLLFVLFFMLIFPLGYLLLKTKKGPAAQ
ncbi:MAG: hypothetical protein ACO1QS_08245 [Verrucomicrobiota bacterium]